jgi:hypothetical protein
MEALTIGLDRAREPVLRHFLDQICVDFLTKLVDFLGAGGLAKGRRGGHMVTLSDVGVNRKSSVALRRSAYGTRSFRNRLTILWPFRPDRA